MVGHICKSDVIALQKGKPGIIVLKIERLPHPLRELVYKTENALVANVPVWFLECLPDEAAAKICCEAIA